MRKKCVICVLVVIMSVLLGACGKSEAVTHTEELISSIGEVSLESEDLIIEAEKAYNALSDKEKEKVENYTILTEAREKVDSLIKAKEEAIKEEERRKAAAEAAKKAREEKNAKLNEAFGGKWINLYSEVVSNDIGFSIGMLGNAERSILINEFGGEYVDDETVIFNKIEYHLINDQGIEKLISSDERSCYVRSEDYDKIFNQMFTVVELNEDNITDYLGPWEKIGEAYDEWDEVSGDEYILASKAYENGLVLLTKTSHTEKVC